MFQKRGYDLDSKQIAYVKAKKIWNVFINDQHGQKVLCILTSVCVTPQEDTIGIQEFSSAERPDMESKQVIFEGCRTKSSKTKKQNIGMDFIKSITAYGKKNGVRLVILISDSVTSHALKAMVKSAVRIVRFTYAETSVLNMTQHINQPVLFRKLTIPEQKEYGSLHPGYLRQLQRYSMNDPLIKYFGFQSGDIIEFEDSDRQSGLCRELGLVVQDVP